MFVYGKTLVLGNYKYGVIENPEYINEKYPNVEHKDWPAYNTYSMWYSVYESNRLKKLYELKHGFEFDVVIRMRTDFALNTVLDFSTMKKDTLYVENARIDPYKVFCSDIFAYGSSKVMDLYSNVFMNIDYLYSNGTKMNGEHMLAGNNLLYGLVGNKLEYVDMKPCFPPGKYNGNWHNIIRDDFKDWNNIRG
jgi:hypothetical protein